MMSYYLEAADDYVKVHTQEGSFLKNKTMSHFEKTLDQQQFVRSHRSYIVNIQQITRIDPYEKDNHIAILKIRNKSACKQKWICETENCDWVVSCELVVNVNLNS